MTVMDGYSTRHLARQLNNELGSLFGVLADGYTATDEASGWTPAVNIYEDEQAYILRADIVGVNPAEVSIEIDAGVLTLAGERQISDTDDTVVISKQECPSGKFRRSFTLPDNINTDAVTARSEFGVLEVTIPRKEKPKPKKIRVTT